MNNPHLKRYQEEADRITKARMTPESRARLQFLLSSISTMKTEFPSERSAVATDPQEFRRKFLSEEFRTYSPLCESSGASLIPSDFEVQLKNLMQADGPLYVGSPILSSLYGAKMIPTKIGVNDDTSSAGSIADENVGFPSADAELTGLSGVTIGASSQRFSTGLLLASMELVSDVTSTFSCEQLILKAASPRLSKIENATFLGILKTALALNSSAAVAADGATLVADDVYTLISAVRAPYRVNGAFVMSPVMQATLGALKTTTGKHQFPELLNAQPKLNGYAVFPIAAADDSDILFGDFSYLYTKSTPVEMRVLRERFADRGFYAYVLSERADAKWTVATTSDSPVKYLTFA